MPAKKKLSQYQRFGLQDDEIRSAELFLKEGGSTTHALQGGPALKLYELFMLGYTLKEVHAQCPEYSYGLIIITAVAHGWFRDREMMSLTMRDRIRAKVVRSVMEQVDFLTAMLSVSTAEHLEAMRSYAINPDKKTLPAMRIQSIKDYKDVIDMLSRMMNNIQSVGKMAEEGHSKRAKALGASISTPKPLPASSDPAKLIANTIAAGINNDKPTTTEQ